MISRLLVLLVWVTAGLSIVAEAALPGTAEHAHQLTDENWEEKTEDSLW
jgi:hypothetical protein